MTNDINSGMSKLYLFFHQLCGCGQNVLPINLVVVQHLFHPFEIH